MSLQRLWAGWRMPYVSGAAASGDQRETEQPEAGADRGREDCVFCTILTNDEPNNATYVV